jgi:hypothetical protein
MSHNWAETMRLVEERAESRCEYCRMHQALQGATFHVEHIKPRADSGSDQLDNFAWACISAFLIAALTLPPFLLLHAGWDSLLFAAG